MAGAVLAIGLKARPKENEYEKGVSTHWDLLILLDKPKLTSKDYDYGYPFREFGWDIGEEISPHIYTKKQWNKHITL